MNHCARCESRDIIAGNNLHFVFLYTALLSYTCGTTDDGVAAVRSFRCKAAMEEWGRPDSDGGWETEEQQEIEQMEEEHGLCRVFCSACVADADPDEWEVEENGREEDRTEQTSFIFCNRCRIRTRTD